MDTIRDISWQRLCKAATLELDRVKLQKRLEAAHAAIQRRLQEDNSRHDGTPTNGQSDIVEALCDLQQLPRVNFRLPTPATGEFGRRHSAHREL